MKTIFLVISAMCMSQQVFAQTFNQIDYKKSANAIYETVISKGEYRTGINELNKLEKQWGHLYTEEYMLKAFCYYKSDNNDSASVWVEAAWSYPIMDPHYLHQIEGFDWVEMCNSFNEAQHAANLRGFEKNTAIRPSYADSIAAALDTLQFIDALWRDSTFPEHREFLPLVHYDLNQDSINFLKYEAIFRKYGFPGETVMTLMSSRFEALYLHWADYPAIYEKMTPLFLEEVKAGRMPTTLFLKWIDRHHVSHNEPVEFATYGHPKNYPVNADMSQYRENRRRYGISDLFYLPYDYSKY